MILVLILAMLVIMFYVKYIGNQDIAKQCCKTEQDKANVKNARKIYSKTKTSIGLIILAGLSLIVILLLNFTNIAYVVKDFISTDFVENTKKEFSLFFYLIPVYVLVCRQIIIEVKVSEFLYKFFNVEEPELEENPLKMLLYKKKPANNKTEPTKEEIKETSPEVKEDTKVTEEVKEEQKVTEEPTEEPATEEVKEEPIELPKENNTEKKEDK